MTRQDHLLVILAEEAAEVAKEVAKALRFGLDDREPGTTTPNRQKIVDELRDLNEVARMLADEGALTHWFDVAKPGKREKVERFLAYSRERGRLEP